MAAGKEFIQRNEITQTLTHLLSVNGDHIVVHPVMNRLFSLRSHSLRNFAFVVREDQVHSASVYIETLAQVLLTHGSTFAMPSREAIAPGRRPAHNMFRGRTLP